MLKLLLITFLFYPQVVKATQSFADHAHSNLSRRILNMANTIDIFFGTDRKFDQVNKTKLRIFADAVKLEGQDPTYEGNIKFQLVLPRTQERLHLVLESSEDKDGQSDNKGAPGASTSTTRSKGEKARDTTTAGLRYILDTADIQTSIGTGVKFDVISPRPFVRLRFSKDTEIKDWLFRPRHEILWITEQGYSTDTDLNFDKSLNNEWLLRFVNNIQWNDDDYIVNLQNGPTWFQKISEKIGMSYNAHIFTDNSPKFSVNNYSLSVGYRQLLYKEWFFWTISPALNFPRSERFHRTPSASVRFEVILGYI